MVGSRVYVGGLPHGVLERDLERFFKGYGPTRDIIIKNGYAFVEFEDHRDADDAIYELNGMELLRQRVVVETARGTRGQADRSDDRFSKRGNNTSRASSRYGPPLRTGFRLIVENLSSRLSWQDLKDFMRKAGEVTFADAHKHRRNEGFVEFATLADMKTAIEKLDDTKLNGRRIRLVEDRRGGRYDGDARRRSRASSLRSRSRSRSRSQFNCRASRSRTHSAHSSVKKSRSREQSRAGSPTTKNEKPRPTA
ncbi:serine-arginine protein 55-like [Scaptodrosophila lebanonensis]|uniref:Serine-arginine protein 55-like n=1 Tax=Drosophila lebanonensis TaxID=7225 RepID=A0A6J2T8B9_DROLE|nr:serine-arginine protein 55-like [Scaptodrosophila lebanonensis]